MRLTLTVSGPVPVDVAWRRYEWTAAWSGWSPQLRGVRSDQGEPEPQLHADLAGQVLGPLGTRARFRVLSLDRPTRRWSWTVWAGPLSLRLEHTLDARADGPGSTAGLVLHGPAPLVLGYAPLARYALHRLVTLPHLAPTPGPGNTG